MIGAGWYGKSDLWRLVQVAPVEIVSVCDPDKNMLKEAVEIGRRAGVKVHISHLKPHQPQHVEELLEYIDRVARHEVDFSFDVYPYLPGSTMLNYLLPYECRDRGPLGVLGTLNGRAVGVMGFTVAGGKIVEIDCLVDPERLAGLDLERLIGTEAR